MLDSEANKTNICIYCLTSFLFSYRALEYVYVFLTCLVEESKQDLCSDNLVPYFNKAYEEKLKPYHGWFVQKLFGVSIFNFSNIKVDNTFLCALFSYGMNHEIMNINFKYMFNNFLLMTFIFEYLKQIYLILIDWLSTCSKIFL